MQILLYRCVFSFQHFKGVVLSFKLICIVFDKASVSFLSLFLYIQCLLRPQLCLLLRLFSLLLDFSSLIINDMPWCGFFVLNLFLFIEFLECYVFSFPQSWKFFGPYFLRYFVLPSFWDASFTIFRLPLIFSQVVNALFFVSFFAFYFHILNLGIFFSLHCLICW